MDAPSDHQLRAALWQARLLDDGDSDGASIQLSRRLTATEGRYPAPALEDGLQLLVEVDLVFSEGGVRRMSEALLTITGLDDDSALELLRRHCERTRRQGSGLLEDQRELVGAIGEDLVTQLARAELVRAGRSELAGRVQRVSLVDDGLGYDVQAPTLDGRLRLMEVKSSTGTGESAFTFFLSRNEYDVGLRNPIGWAVVACRVGLDRSVEGAEILGWTPASTLRPYLPDDGNGRWTEARVRLPRSALTSGMPPAV